MTTKRHGAPPWLAELEVLRARRGSGVDGKLLLDGLRLVEAAHAAGLPIERVLHAPEFFSDAARAQAQADALLASGVPAQQLAAREFSRISYKADGVVAVVRYASPTLEDVLARPGVVLVLDGLSDPGNIGAVVRTANAWGAAGVVAIDARERLRHPKCVRASMGALFHTPTCAASREALLARLRDREIIALAPDGETPWPPGDLDLARDLVLVLGNERRGVHHALARRATRRVALPMSGFVDSLNVSNAAAVVLWELFQRRRGA